MEVRRYKDSDYEILKTWQETRNESMPSSDMLSDIGFIIEDTAVVFLYTTNSKIAYLETMITNPLAKNRRIAIDSITYEALEHAKHIGVKLIISTSISESVISLSEYHGFKATGNYTLLLKNLIA